MAVRVRRLKKRSQFLQVAAARRKWVTPGLIVQGRRRDPDVGAADLGEAGSEDNCNNDIGLGFTVSKKVGKAVERNRAKRRLRAVADAVVGDCGASGFDYVVIGRKATLQRPFARLTEDLQQALRRVSQEKRAGRHVPSLTQRQGRVQ